MGVGVGVRDSFDSALFAIVWKHTQDKWCMPPAAVMV